ncbi:MAG: UDP-N-acetylglucosamine 2-epimerase (non-hydrolyzing) [Bacteroidetes bacterium]|nr:MAG: UDP-N-acetylglucosamine 2-epimerase (non-hydrolyzing) [Bacteroidota bacterium]
MKIITIVGARPQIIKASAISRAIRNHFSEQVEELIVHTGQHYDENMSAIFFEELEIPKPYINLQVGSSGHAQQTAEIMQGVEKIIQDTQANAVLIYGDTNSTIAAALAASKIHIPVIHVEAGLRSFNKHMPEEINRILSDHVSSMLFCPTKAAVKNLEREGFSLNPMAPAEINHPIVYHCGDVMFDNSLHFSTLADKKSEILQQLHLEAGNFILVTIHRNANTDERERLNSIFRALVTLQLQLQINIVLPLHPRTRKMMETLLDEDLQAACEENASIQIIPPAGFLDIISLERNARLVITDSGGLQKEAYFFEKPCVILRPETEWVEIVENGNAILADADENRILKAAHELLEKKEFSHPSIFGDGRASEFIVQKIIDDLTC